MGSNFEVSLLMIVLILAWLEVYNAKAPRTPILLGRFGGRSKNIASHSCIQDQILEQRKRPGRKVYSVTPQVYKPGLSKHLQLKVGHSPDRNCQKIGDIVKSLVIVGITALLKISQERTKKHRLRKALGQTADWFRRVLSVEPVKGNLRLSGYSAC
ncbi:hypothetical protein VNO80_12551 [Phaseolus coccineus]|uniref:Uncharacterized protein n=1 Tax=Phaseolus coccineus TaxID=3886 RepID=A0AAN9RAS3_PHACN